MCRGFGVSMALVLLLISGAFADVQQGQSFGVSATNDGDLTTTGIGGTSSINVVPLTNVQSATDGEGFVQLSQIGIASLVQGASATGLYGLYGYDQSAVAIGGQSQASYGYLDAGVQDQDIGTYFAQDVYGVGLLGTAVAAQSFIGGQSQIITTPYGIQANIQCLGISMADGTGGSAVDVVSRTLTIDHGIGY